MTLKTETNTCHQLLFFMRDNLAKLHSVLNSRFYLAARQNFFFLWSVKARCICTDLIFFLFRWYWKVSGDQASRETSPSMTWRWRKGSVETRRPVSSTTFLPPMPPVLSLQLQVLALPFWTGSRFMRGDLILDSCQHWTTVSCGKKQLP